MHENPYYLQAYRKMDIRIIYLCAMVNDDMHVELSDVLFDSEFILSKIDEDEYFYAFDNCRWVYTLNDENFDKFDDFIRSNYINILKLFSQQPKQIK